jgi:acyl-CoA reductase-like NAD-dependent aldehyde dehydrogenase
MVKRAEQLQQSAELRTDFTLLIDGEARTSATMLDVINPATGLVFARCPAAGRAELDEAVAAARRAFPAWRDAGFVERTRLIRAFTAALRAEQDALARLLTTEQGKPLSQSLAEIDRGAAQSDDMVGIEIPVELLIDNERRAHRAALSPARRRRHHHAVERAGERSRSGRSSRRSTPATRRY